MFSLILVFGKGYSQTIKPNGVFLKDTVKVGEPVQYSLSIRYPVEMDIVFPDSLFNFTPFEINQKDYFFTESNDEISFDSTIYNLSTFELDSVQYLRLPVFVVTTGDSNAVYPDRDSVIIQHLVTQLPDSLNLIENTVYKEVSLQFNYPYLIAGFIIFVVLVIMVIVLFGKQIKRKYVLFKLKRSHNKFIKAFKKAITDSELHIENTLFQWKKYMEKLEKFPYTKLTTKEILSIEGNLDIKQELRSIDKVIYGNEREKEIDRRFENLLGFTDRRYREKVEKIKYGAGD